jgi:hypothetical protein
LLVLTEDDLLFGLLLLPLLCRMGSILGRLVGLATTDIADKYGQLLSSECAGSSVQASRKGLCRNMDNGTEVKAVVLL